MYYGADIHTTPGPQRSLGMIGTRVCTKSIKFLLFQKKPDVFPHISPQILSFSKPHEILKFAFMCTISAADF